MRLARRQLEELDDRGLLGARQTHCLPIAQVAAFGDGSGAGPHLHHRPSPLPWTSTWPTSFISHLFAVLPALFFTTMMQMVEQAVCYIGLAGGSPFRRLTSLLVFARLLLAA
eukprot:TRINITY_DN23447_c0_g1_i1.p3 TRINITY_DN23447_c0_g1~~TRINITY_DN23447_c0_g1_i1.p3  ORF type:complete len:112 (+),score=7.05 TRINITY_DN23447_c0_g1_i1:271-606(+)